MDGRSKNETQELQNYWKFERNEWSCLKDERSGFLTNKV